MHSLIETREGLGKIETVMQTREKSKTLLFRALIKREILTSREVLYTKLVRVISLFCEKDAFQNTGFSRLKCQLKRKKLTQHVVKIFQVSTDEEMGK